MLVPCNEWMEQLHYHSILFGCIFFSSVRYVNYLKIKYILVVLIHPDNFLPYFHCGVSCITSAIQPSAKIETL